MQDDKRMSVTSPLKEWGPLALYIWTTIEKQNNEKE
jgi:hypothetical protein